MKSGYKVTIVIFLSVIITTLGISATEIASNISGRFSGLVIDSQAVCQTGEQLVQFAGYAVCVDIYEASASPQCPIQVPNNPDDTAENISSSECRVVSEADRIPWRFVSYNEAVQMCARVQKRLLNNDEWYKLASGLVNTQDCNLSDSKGEPKPTGVCSSPLGVFDLVGNVWEWLDASTKIYKESGLPVPLSGYVAEVNVNGLAVTTTDTPKPEFGLDYATFSKEQNKDFIIIRGGFYGSGDDGGLYSLNGAVDGSLRTAGIGFRCIRDIY